MRSAASSAYRNREHRSATTVAFRVPSKAAVGVSSIPASAGAGLAEAGGAYSGSVGGRPKRGTSSAPPKRVMAAIPSCSSPSTNIPMPTAMFEPGCAR